jgi:hypothetical protein
MRVLAIVLLMGSLVASGDLAGQILTEQAAAATGATIGTAAGKPIGTALGKIFANADGSANGTSKDGPAAKSKAAKSALAAPTVKAGSPAAHAAVPSESPATSSEAPIRRARPIPSEPQPAAIVPIAPVAAAATVKEPTSQAVAGIQVGATAGELSTALGVPESRVSIPGDDGHLVEIYQYWGNGEPVGTVHLDNGRVVSVKAGN